MNEFMKESLIYCVSDIVLICVNDATDVYPIGLVVHKVAEFKKQANGEVNKNHKKKWKKESSLGTKKQNKQKTYSKQKMIIKKE